MEQELIRVYNKLSNAQQAREQLLAEGFSESDVHLSSRQDEAGPVEGNFTVGNGGPADQGLSGLLGSSVDIDDDVYAYDYEHPVQRGTILLRVDAADPAQRARAAGIMDRYGPVPVR